MDRTLMRPAFTLLWLSESAFELGSALMGFALGVWIFQRTGSAEQFSMVVLAAALPALFVTPIAGAMADRLDRRWVIVSCDAVEVLMIVFLALLLSQDSLEVHHLYIFNAVTATVGTVRTPAYKAALSGIVPKEQLTQANGLIGATQGLLQVAAPLSAGYLIGVAGLEGVVLVEMMVVVAAGVAAFAALSRTRSAIRGAERSKRLPILAAISTSFVAAIRYFKRMPLMVGLGAYGMLHEGLLVLVTVLMTPLVLSTYSSDVLGLILTCGAMGAMAGAGLLVIIRVNTRMMIWVLVSDVCLSLFVVLAGFTVSWWLWCICAFFALFSAAASDACATTLWMKKTPKSSRGSIFAFTNALDLSAMCLALLVAGHLGEHVFEPALAIDGAWADTVGVWTGTGVGRGLGFMFILCGSMSFLLSVLALMHTRLRRLDESVKDPPDELATTAVPDSAVAT